MFNRFTAIALTMICLNAAAAQQTKLLNGFEADGDLRFWEFKKSSAALTDQHVGQGTKAAKVSTDEYMITFRRMDWSGFESLDMDMFLEGDDPVSVSILIADEDWNKKKDYWNRHNGSFTLKPGSNTLSIPVNGLFRGEAGSRGNDLKTNINPKEIIRLDLGFQTKGKPGSIYVDNMRLTKETRPEGILAFDFGPKSQVVFPGFTPISYDTVYGKDGAKAGLKQARPSSYQARDDLFPTRLYQDCVVLDWGEFVVDLPNGKYNVWLVYNDCGYWGGEQARFTKRWIDAEGQRAWNEDRTDGAADYLYHFENIEPRPGDSIWELYVNYLFTPKRFQADVKDGQLNLRFGAEGVNGSKVAAIIIYPEAIKADAEKWVAEIEERNRKEFESRAVFMGQKANKLTPPIPQNLEYWQDEALSKGLWFGVPSWNQEFEKSVLFTDPPEETPQSFSKQLMRVAARGHSLSLTFALRPLRDVGDGAVQVTCNDVKAIGGFKIPSDKVDIRYVQHALQRSFNNIEYSISAETLRPVNKSNLKLQNGVTRQFWITVPVPENATPGQYIFDLTFVIGDLKIVVPLSFYVEDIVLDEPNFLMGFYGTHVPDDLPPERKKTALKELMTLLKQYGMNALSGGPGIHFSGFEADGKPKLDFAACDEYFKTARECGFTKPFIAYGGPAMVHGLHDGYVIGNTGRDWEKKTGKPFGELLKIVWGAVKEHAEKYNWPEVYYSMCDEPRVLEQVTPLLECMKAYRDNVPFVKIGGSYSVHWGEKPFDKAVQEIFKVLQWSALNLHAQVDLDKAKEFGREVQIYNQGTTRYSFGAYQWAEFRKGITARMQWHLLALHGYQFFDLDGREPDTAMINWGRNEIIPTIALARCREGADDFRFAVTLWNLAEKHKDRAEAKAAQAWLDEVAQKIGVNQTQRPKDFMDDETFRNTCIEHIKKIKAAK